MSEEQTIYIVDDDEDIRTSLSRAMKIRGYNVETYASGQAFLDALLLDQGMPNMTGLELQRRLVDMGHNIPTIFMSGHGGIEHSAQAMKMGAIDFLEKPFPQKLLAMRIKVALGLEPAT